MTAPSDQDLTGFVLYEARLLDQHRFEEWLDLFADDGRYWMPLEWGQTDPRLTARFPRLRAWGEESPNSAEQCAG